MCLFCSSGARAYSSLWNRVVQVGPHGTVTRDRLGVVTGLDVIGMGDAVGVMHGELD